MTPWSISTSLDIEVTDPKLYAQRYDAGRERTATDTVGRFTVWVIVAVIAIMVVYFMAYGSIEETVALLS